MYNAKKRKIMQKFKHFCKLQDKVVALHIADACEFCGAEDLINNRHMQDFSVEDYELMPMTNATAVELGIKTYTPLTPCKRGHSNRFTKAKVCVECKRAYDIKYKKQHKVANAKRSAQYRLNHGDEYREKMRKYMIEYRKTDKHSEYITEYKSRKGITKS